MPYRNPVWTGRKILNSLNDEKGGSRNEEMKKKVIKRGGTFNGKRPEMVSAPDQINFLDKSSFEIAQKSMLIFILERGGRDRLRKFER